MKSSEKPAPATSTVPQIDPYPVIDYAANGVDTGVDPSRPGLSSLVFGLLFFVPVILQVYAIGMGLIALRQPRRSADRAFGLAGLILGSAALVWWIWITVRLLHGNVI
jgi:hypothetical protein